MKMPVEALDPRMFAPCGMNCMVCYKHCAHKKACPGCFGSGTDKPEHCRQCALKDCAVNQGVSYCYECAQYPCARIRRLEKSYQSRYGVSLMENSRCVAELGRRAFMERQKTVYTCPQCGGVISLHDKQCSECGRKIPE